MAGYQAEELLRGFGVRFSFTGHDLHGLKFGPDGRLYFSCGDRGTHLVTKEGRVIDLPDEGAVFRCEPDGSNLEVVHHGLRNPQELAFNEYGDLFTGDNDSDQGDRERWVQVIEGADSGWRVGHQHAPLGNAGMWNLERLWVPPFEGQAAYVLPPLANIGDGPSGLVYDYGTGLDASLRHRFLLAYFKGTSAKIELAEKLLTLYGDSDFQLEQIKTILLPEMTKKNVDVRCLDYGDVQKISGNKVKQEVKVRVGVEQELAKKIVKLLKDSKMKVQAAIQGDAVRVSGAKRDVLQEAIALVKKQITDFPLQYGNFRD